MHLTNTGISGNYDALMLPTGISSTFDASGISPKREYIPSPSMLSVLPPNNPSTGEDSLLIPRLINLETADLRQSPRIAALNGVTQDSPTIAAYASSTTQIKS